MIRSILALIAVLSCGFASAQTKPAEADLPAFFQSTVYPFFATGEPIDFVGEGGIHLRSFEFRRGPHAIVIVPGWGESARKWAETAYDLTQKGYTVFLYTHRGQGESQRIAKCRCTYVETYHNYIQDLANYVNRIVRPQGFSKVFMLAHSMGGGIATETLLENSHLVDGAVLSSPLHQPITKPWPEPIALGIVKTLVALGHGQDRRPFDDKSVEQFKTNIRTHSLVRWTLTYQINKDHPELDGGWGTNRWVLEMLRMTRQIRNGGQPMTMPVLLLQADEDKYVVDDAQNKMCAKWGSTCHLIHFPGTLHELFEAPDHDRDLAMGAALRFFQSLQ